MAGNVGAPRAAFRWSRSGSWNSQPTGHSSWERSELAIPRFHLGGPLPLSTESFWAKTFSSQSDLFPMGYAFAYYLKFEGIINIILHPPILVPSNLAAPLFLEGQTLPRCSRSGSRGFCFGTS